MGGAEALVRRALRPVTQAVRARATVARAAMGEAVEPRGTAQVVREARVSVSHTLEISPSKAV